MAVATAVGTAADTAAGEGAGETGAGAAGGRGSRGQGQGQQDAATLASQSDSSFGGCVSFSFLSARSSVAASSLETIHAPIAKVCRRSATVATIAPHHRTAPLHRGRRCQTRSVQMTTSAPT